METEVFLIIVKAVGRANGGSVTSWFRSPAHNQAVGGASTSLHLTGEAVDLVFDTPDGEQRAADALRACGFGVLAERDHLHVQVRPLAFQPDVPVGGTR